MNDGQSTSEPCPPAPAIFVWTCWALFSAIALALTLRYAVEVPIYEEWITTVDFLTGDLPLTASNLWRPVNEHRIPAPLLFSMGMFHLSGGRLWAEVVATDAMLIALAAGMLWLTRRLRGKYIYADAFVPLLFLHCGHSDLFVYRVANHVIASVFSTLVLAWIISRQRIESAREIVGVGATLLILALCGANGLPVVLGGAAWLVMASWGACREKPRLRWLACISAVASVALVGFYFVGYRSPRHIQPQFDPRQLAFGAASCLSRSLLPPDLNLEGAIFIAPAFVLSAVALLVMRTQRDRDEIWRGTGIALFLGAMSVVCLGISFGRSALDPFACAISRYAIITAPMMLAVYLIWTLHGPRSWSEAIATALFMALCSGFYGSARDGIAQARHLDRESRALMRGIRGGTPEECIAQRNIFVPPGANWDEGVSRRLARLRAKSMGPYRGMAPSQSVTIESRLATTPTHVQQMTLADDHWQATGADPQMFFSLPHPQQVKAIGMRIVLDRPDHAAGVVEGFWMHQGVNRFRTDRRYERIVVSMGPAEQMVWFFVDDMMDRFRFDPDSSAHRLEIREIRVLAAADSDGLPSESTTPLAVTPTTSRK